MSEIPTRNLSGCWLSKSGTNDAARFGILLYVWSMNQNLSAIERAFELARHGSCRTVAEIKTALKAERYDVSTIVGGTLSKQLRALIDARVEK